MEFTEHQLAPSFVLVPTAFFIIVVVVFFLLLFFLFPEFIDIFFSLIKKISVIFIFWPTFVEH
jgi:hypothetical protein